MHIESDWTLLGQNRGFPALREATIIISWTLDLGPTLPQQSTNMAMFKGQCCWMLLVKTKAHSSPNCIELHCSLTLDAFAGPA